RASGTSLALEAGDGLELRRAAAAVGPPGADLPVAGRRGDGRAGLGRVRRGGPADDRRDAPDAVHSRTSGKRTRARTDSKPKVGPETRAHFSTPCSGKLRESSTTAEDEVASVPTQRVWGVAPLSVSSTRRTKPPPRRGRGWPPGGGWAGRRD